MNIWSLFLPFKWFIIGVGEVLSGIVSLLKWGISLIGSMFKYLFEGIAVVSRGIIFLLINIVFNYLFLGIKWIVSNVAFLFLLFFRGLKVTVIWIFRVLKYIVTLVFRGIKFILSNFFKVIRIIVLIILRVVKFVVVNFFKGLSVIIKGLFKTVKYIIIYAYKVIYFIFKYLYIIIKTILVTIVKIIKFIFINVLYKYFGVFINSIFKAIINGLKFIEKIPSYIAMAIKMVGAGLYKIFIYPFVYLYKNVGRIIQETIQNVKDKVKESVNNIINLPKNVVESTKKWFYGLSFVKDIRNRREMKRQALLIDFDAYDAIRSEKKMQYRYTARNPEGKIEKGNLGAYSKLDVHSYLLAEGYEVYEIKPAGAFNASIGGGGKAQKLSVSEMVFLLTQLSTYIRSGIPLVDSIKILGKQSKKKGVQSLYKSIIYDLTMGDSFSEALEKQGSAFPRLLVNMIKSSELAGNLAETLDDMAEYYTAVSNTQKQMKSAMTYPTVILVFALSVVVFILTFVIPSFIDMYKDAEAEVPALTMTIINLSDFLVENALFLALGVVGAIAAFYFMYKNVKVFRLLIQWLLMHTPVLGKIIIYNEVTMFAKTFASLWNHNVFITNSMEILSKITENEIYKMLIFDAITNVARGETVSSSFKDHWAFPIVAYEMLMTGERTGQPGPMMDKVAAYYQEEHKNAVNQVKAFIEPALIVVLAVVVGVILLSVVLPMFSIYGELGLE